MAVTRVTREAHSNRNTVLLTVVANCNCGCKVQVEFTSGQRLNDEVVVALGGSMENTIESTVLAGCSCGCKVEVLVDSITY